MSEIYYSEQSSEINESDIGSYSKGLIGLGFVTIVILLIGFFLLMYFLLKMETNVTQLVAADTSGTLCSGQTCGVGFYCDGNGVCRVGTGEGISQACGSDADCTFGLRCLTTTHVCGVDNNHFPTSNFRDQQLVTTINGTKQYLLIDETGSYLGPNKPLNYSFDYSTKNGISFRSASPIYSGKFVGYGQKGQLIISTLSEGLKVQTDRSGNHQILNPVCKTSNGGQALYYIANASGTTTGINLGATSSGTMSSGTTNVGNNSGTSNAFVESCPRIQINSKKCQTHRKRNCQLCSNLSLRCVTARTISRVIKGKSSGSDTIDQIISTIFQNQPVGSSMNQIQTAVNSAINLINTSVAQGQPITSDLISTVISSVNGNNVGTGLASGLTTGLTSGLASGLTNQPYLSYFPVPSNNSTLSDRCPSTWGSINGAQVILFQLEPN